MTHRRILAHLVLVIATLAAVLLVARWPPVPQPVTYHAFADRRSLLGLPNCLDVVSNLPFAVMGGWGLLRVWSIPLGPTGFRNAWERWPYATLFLGVALTTLGSGYYHLSPDNARLVWDRLPMSIGFMGLLTALFAERVSIVLARWAFVPLLALGAASVGYWYWTETQGAGDLRSYLLVQFGSLLFVVLLLVLYPARYRGTAYLVMGLLAYSAAKVFELADNEIYAIGRIVSGHTLKHLAAAAGVGCVIIMLNARAPRTLDKNPSNIALQATR